ncbi:hypothetical protein V4F39_17640 [Aquincola sp. MAHUQ-54]|uniref:Uncharacterized protein n=1 Tax=Aquincola agrisoli TaxID=3119538 RepID=A0AAW9QEK9_9BURK
MSHLPHSAGGADAQASRQQHEDPAARQREQSEAALSNVRRDYDKTPGLGHLVPEPGEERVDGGSDPAGAGR